METDLKFGYGERVSDMVTGLTGNVTGFAYYYDKIPCSYRLESIDSTGRPICEWVEEVRLAKAEE